jgi:hypothetical protein
MGGEVLQGMNFGPYSYFGLETHPGLKLGWTYNYYIVLAAPMTGYI